MVVKPELMACSACGGMVPERDLYPYAGHTKDCPDAKEWRQACEGRLRGRDAVDDCLRKDDEIRVLKIKLTKARAANKELRQLLKDALAGMGGKS